MHKYKIIIFLLCAVISNLFAQNYVVKQKALSIDEEQMIKLAGNEDPQKISAFFFDSGLDDLLKKINSGTAKGEAIESVFMLENKRMRMDMESHGEKMSYIINLETKQVIAVIHKQKQYMEMNLDEIKAMQEQLKQSMAQMQNMQGMMENLPPEAKAMMEKMAGKKDQNPPQVTATGKSSTINGFPCKQFLIESDESRDRLWITTKYPDLRDSFFEMSKAFPSEGEKMSVVYEKINEGWPVLSHSMMTKRSFGGSYNISEIYSIEKASHKKGTFDPPAGYKKTDMPNMQMPGM
jgi:hypothetical protein